MNIPEISLWPGNDMCIIDDILWFFHGGFNAFIKYDLVRKRIDVKCVSRECYDSNFLLFNKIFFSKGYIYLIPCFANCIAIYNIENDEFKYISIDTKIKEVCYEVAFMINEYIYCFSKWYNHILIFNTERNIIDSIIQLPDKEDSFENFLVGEGCVCDDRIFIPLYSFAENCNKILVYNTVIKKCDYIKVDVNTRGFRSAQVIGKELYLESKEFILYKINLENNKLIQKVKEFDQEFRIVGKWNEKLFIDLENNKQEFYLFDTKLGNWSIRDFTKVCEKNNISTEIYIGVFKEINSNKYAYYNRCKGILFVFDNINNKVHSYDIKLSREENEKLYELIKQNMDISMIHEKEKWNINLFIEKIIDK